MSPARPPKAVSTARPAIAACLMLAATVPLAACAGNSAIQPDRTVFSLDNTYQRYTYPMSIEQTFDRTIAVFKEAGYKLDVIDRATGQISGIRGATGDKGANTDKGLKFYALVLPKGSGSELGIKIVQVIKNGPLGTSQAELIVNDNQMYQYSFRRIQNAASEGSTAARPQTEPSGYAELPGTGRGFAP